MLDEQALNADDVAHMLHISRNSVYKLAKEGPLPSYKVGRKLFFTKSDVQEFIDSKHRRLSSRTPSSSEVSRTNTNATLIDRIHLPGNPKPEKHRSADGIILAGDDLIADVLANYAMTAGIQVSKG